MQANPSVAARTGLFINASGIFLALSRCFDYAVSRCALFVHILLCSLFCHSGQCRGKERSGQIQAGLKGKRIACDLGSEKRDKIDQDKHPGHGQHPFFIFLFAPSSFLCLQHSTKAITASVFPLVSFGRIPYNGEKRKELKPCGKSRPGWPTPKSYTAFSPTRRSHRGRPI